MLSALDWKEKFYIIQYFLQKKNGKHKKTWFTWKDYYGEKGSLASDGIARINRHALG